MSPLSCIHRRYSRSCPYRSRWMRRMLSSVCKRSSRYCKSYLAEWCIGPVERACRYCRSYHRHIAGRHSAGRTGIRIDSCRVPVCMCNNLRYMLYWAGCCIALAQQVCNFDYSYYTHIAGRHSPGRTGTGTGSCRALACRCNNLRCKSCWADYYIALAQKVCSYCRSYRKHTGGSNSAGRTGTVIDSCWAQACRCNSLRYKLYQEGWCIAPLEEYRDYPNYHGRSHFGHRIDNKKCMFRRRIAQRSRSSPKGRNWQNLYKRHRNY